MASGAQKLLPFSQALFCLLPAWSTIFNMSKAPGPASPCRGRTVPLFVAISGGNFQSLEKAASCPWSWCRSRQLPGEDPMTRELPSLWAVPGPCPSLALQLLSPTWPGLEQWR